MLREAARTPGAAPPRHRRGDRRRSARPGYCRRRRHRRWASRIALLRAGAALPDLAVRRHARAGSAGRPDSARRWRAAPARLTSPGSTRISRRPAPACWAGTIGWSPSRPKGRYSPRQDNPRQRNQSKKETRRDERQCRRQGPRFHLADRRRRLGHACRSCTASRWCSISTPRTTPRAAPPRPAGFATLFPDYGKTGAMVIGISKDSVASHDKFKAKYAAALHARLRQRRQGRARATASGSRRACTAANTWASTAAPS